MSRRPILAFAADVPADALAALEASGATPAWLIDVDRGRILAATASGAAVLGLSAGARAVLLDAAMPALRRLRALRDQEAVARQTGAEPLVFWTGAGAVRCLGDVALLWAGGACLAAVTAHATSLAGDGDDAARLEDTAEESQEAAATRARLAHEIRTPLGAIAAAAEVIGDQRLGPVGTARYLGYARDIHASASHALALVERMLGEAKASLAPAADALAFSEVDTAALLETTVSQIGALAERAGLTLALALQPRLPHLVADATSLRQIVLNLVGNALKFTPPGGHVTVAARYEGDGPLTIAVSDTGRGMTPREVADALGGRRAAGRDEASTAAGGTGLGLGLRLVQALAAANGAELVIESAAGHGTSASVVFRSDRVVPV